MVGTDFFARERAAAIRWARRLIDRPDWLILDTETTGLDDDAEICQLAIIAPSGAVILDTLIRPSVPIPPEATAIHGIDDATVAEAPTFRDLHERICGHLLTPSRLIIYNAAFDTRLLWQSAAAQDPDFAGIYQGWHHVECAMLEYARFVGEWNDYHQSFRWQKLPPIPGQTGHTAIADCRATLALIKRMAEAEG